MSLQRIIAVSGLFVATTSSIGCAQGLGQRLAVEVTVQRIDVSGDTVRMTYGLKNQTSSREQLFIFSLDVPMGTLAMSAPGDEVEDWALGRKYRGKNVAEWGALNNQLEPGESVDSLSYTAIGVVGLADATIGGYVPPQPLPTEAEMRADPSLATDPDPRIARAIRVPVPAIVLAPAGGNSGLLALLKRDEGAICVAPSGANRGLCRSLDAKLLAADAALGRGNTAAALGPLGAFVNELTTPATAKAQLGQTYWLLLGNAKALIARLGGS